uniref:Uncharacterized protein n=1 Tax=Anguilla anguilla TaxID=7936 RepID=A0A0E9SR61_ANGAN
MLSFTTGLAFWHQL